MSNQAAFGLAEAGQSLVGIKPGGVAITPADVNCIFSNGIDFSRANAWREGFSFEGALARHFVHALSARTLGSNFKIGENKDLTRVPGNEQFGGAKGFEFVRFH